MTNLTAQTLRELAGKATKGDLTTAMRHTHEEWVECPLCGDGEVSATDYCNFDRKALGVQFYGIGSEFGAHENLWSALMSNLPTILAALELQERVNAPETVEAAARAMDDHICREGQDFEWSEKFMMWPEKALSEIAQAAIAALKGTSQ